MAFPHKPYFCEAMIRLNIHFSLSLWIVITIVIDILIAIVIATSIVIALTIWQPHKIPTQGSNSPYTQQSDALF